MRNRKMLEKHGARKRLSKLAPLIRRRFEKLLEKYLRASKNLVFEYEKTSITGSPATVYYIQKSDSSRSRRSVYDTLNDEVFRYLRKDLVALSSKGSTISSILSVTIAGLNVEPGDSLPTNIGAAAKQLEARRAPKRKVGKQEIPSKGTGFQLGHTRGPATIAADRLLAAFKELGEGIVGFDRLYRKAQKKVAIVHAFDAQIQLNKVIFDFASARWQGSGNISIIDIEQAAKNQVSGGKAGKALERLRNWIVRNSAVLLEAQGSPSIQSLVIENIIDQFIGLKTKPVKVNRKVRRKKTVRGKSGASLLKMSGKKKSKNIKDLEEIAKENEGDPNADLNSLLSYLNTRLHDKIQQNMGKGGSELLLNYRTGRFAKSAEIVSLYDVKEKGAIGAQVRYMKDPYRVFEPPGHLHKPGRDPHRIFGRSIRQLLQEEKIVTLRKVKVDLTNG